MSDRDPMTAPAEGDWYRGPRGEARVDLVRAGWGGEGARGDAVAGAADVGRDDSVLTESRTGPILASMDETNSKPATTTTYRCEECGEEVQSTGLTVDQSMYCPRHPDALIMSCPEVVADPKAIYERALATFAMAHRKWKDAYAPRHGLLWGEMRDAKMRAALAHRAL